jgi:hypothetical protein
MVHDVDFKEPTFARAETAGVAAMIDGVVATTPGDDARLTLGATLLDGLYAALSARGGAP